MDCAFPPLPRTVCLSQSGEESHILIPVPELWCLFEPMVLLAQFIPLLLVAILTCLRVMIGHHLAHGVLQSKFKKKDPCSASQHELASLM